ncbi:MAG: lysophospholipase L1-like esterase [Herbinix sp.]|jgi:lysophospholipase L1-like esterase|nr:lysophospholipase L1-like esterase [Herbinix sp.]
MLSEAYDKFLEYSVLDLGNNSRIKSVLKKAEAGEHITFAFLGGSITEGYKVGRENCYGKIFSEKFGGEYSSIDNIHSINAGLAGTDSLMGLIRVERDVLQYKPDLIFVEFAVNDIKDALHREAYESLLLRLLKSEKMPAILLIFVRAQAGYTCQGQMQAAGEYYHLPMISISDAISLMMEEENMLWSDYADDHIHPHKQGNILIADCILHYISKVNAMSSDTELELPVEPLYGDSYVTMQLIDAENALLSDHGDFKPDKRTYQFVHGLMHGKVAGKQPFLLRIKAKHLFVIYRESNDTNAGCADVYIDGIRKCSLDSYKITGWDNPDIRHILSQDTVSEHSIEIKMSSGEEHKEFAILAFGYCD